jgi:hypothetical protein
LSSTHLLRLQRLAGNRAVGGLLSTAPRTAAPRLARSGLFDPIDLDDINERRERHIDVTAYVFFDPDSDESVAVNPYTGPVNRRVHGFRKIPSRPDEATVPIKAGTSGVVTIRIFGEIEVPGEGTTHPGVFANWRVTTNRQGAITAITPLGDGATFTNADMTGRASLALTHAGVGADKDARMLQLAIGFSGAAVTLEKSKTEKGIGWDFKLPDFKVIPLPEGGLKSEPDETTKGRQRALPAFKETRNFLVKIAVTDPEKPAPPPQKLPVPPPRIRANEWRVRFGHNEGEVPAGERALLARWWDGLHPETKRKAAAGEPVIHIDSYTDTTGKVGYNDTLADSRRSAVEKALLRKVGRRIVWAKEGAPAEDVLATDVVKQETREPALRRSVIWVDEQEMVTVPTPDEHELAQIAAARREEEEAAKKRQSLRNRAAVTSPQH